MITLSEKRALIHKRALNVLKSKTAAEDTKTKSFRELYSQAKTPKERDELIYQYAIRQPKPKMVPITVPGPDGTKITFQVMQDFFTIDGIRVSPSPPTAQRIARHFGMELPTAKMADLIHQNSNKVPARPLSGTGVTIEGRHYSPEEVVSGLISDPRATIEYSRRVSDQLASQEGMDPNKPVDGFAKSIVQPEPGAENRAAYYGIWTSVDSHKPEQGGIGTTPHGLDQQEYITWLRGVDNGNVIVTDKNGRQIRTTLDRALNTRHLSSALTFNPGVGIRGYTVKSDGPPPGYRSANIDPAVIDEATSAAKSLLDRPYGSEITVTLSNGKTYLARKERHSNKPFGISLYEKIDSSKPNSGITTTSPTPPTPPTPPASPSSAAPRAREQNSRSQRLSIMDRINNFLNEINEKLG
jgi:hypothetical protein